MQVTSDQFIEHILVEIGRAAMILAANYSGQYFAKTKKGQRLTIPTMRDKIISYVGSVLFISIYLVFFLLIDGLNLGLITTFIVLSSSSLFGTWHQYMKESKEFEEQTIQNTPQ